jgi:hypothetical protein
MQAGVHPCHLTGVPGRTRRLAAVYETTAKHQHPSASSRSAASMRLFQRCS